MARILITVWPFPGHFFPLVPIAHALQARGHTVCFYSGEAACRVLREEGFACAPFQAIDEAWLETIMFSQAVYGSRRNLGQLRALLDAWLLGSLPEQIIDLSPLIEDWQPDLILTETAMFAPILLFAEKTSIPVAVFSTFIACMLSGPDAPPFGLGLPRPNTWFKKLLAHAVRWGSQRLGRNFRDNINEVRRAHQLPPLTQSITDHAGQLPLYLVPSIPELDYQRRDLPPTVHYVGPCLWDKAGTDVSGESLIYNPEYPSLLVTQGTMHTQGPLLIEAASAAFGGQPYNVIITLGALHQPGRVTPADLPPNVRIIEWISHRALLPQIDVVVTTGGAGTVMAVLRAGKPMVVVPTDWDKPENAQRVAASGAGVRLPPWRCSPSRLRNVVDRLLRQPDYRQAAQAMAARLSAQDGPYRAAELIEALLPAEAGSTG